MRWLESLVKMLRYKTQRQSKTDHDEFESLAKMQEYKITNLKL